LKTNYLEIMRSLFYKNLADNKTQNNNGIPNINEIKEFWSNIWSNEVQFNNQAEWIPNLENEIPGPRCTIILLVIILVL
jgi:hypothetical protein